MWRHKEKTAVYKPRGRSLEEISLLTHWSWASSFWNCEKKWTCWYWSHSVHGTLLRQPKQLNTEVNHSSCLFPPSCLPLIGSPALPLFIGYGKKFDLIIEKFDVRKIYDLNHSGVCMDTGLQGSKSRRRFPAGSGSTESAFNAGDPGSILGSGRSPRERKGNPL